jgi:nitrilase
MSQHPLSKLRVAWVQHTATACVETNLAQVEQALAHLKTASPDVVVLPEAFAWLARDMSAMADIVEDFGSCGRLQSQCQSWARELGCYLIAGSLPLRMNGSVYATLCVYNPQGQLETYYRKIHLFSVVTPMGSVYAEGQFFRAGQEPVIWCSPWGKIGLSICFDLRFAALFHFYAKNDVLLTILPAAFTLETGAAHWHVLVRARAIENQMLILAVNQVGEHEQGMQSYGHSLLVDAWGRVLLDSGEMPTQQYYDLDLAPVEALRQQFPVIKLNSSFAQK